MRGGREGFQPEKWEPKGLGSYNFRNGRNGGLKSALRVMEQENTDLGVLQQMKENFRLNLQN